MPRDMWNNVLVNDSANRKRPVTWPRTGPALKAIIGHELDPSTVAGEQRNARSSHSDGSLAAAGLSSVADECASSAGATTVPARPQADELAIFFQAESIGARRHRHWVGVASEKRRGHRGKAHTHR